MVQQMVTFTNHAFARVGFKLRGTPEILGILGIVATFFCQIMLKTKKKVLPSERRALGTVPFIKSGPGYCITFIEKVR